MIKLYIGIFGISLIVNFINYYFAKMVNPTFFDLFKGALYMLPLQFIIGLSFAYYYSKGIEYLSFGVLSTIYYPITIGISIIISMFLFKNHSLSLYDILGIVFTLIGMTFFMLSKTQGN